MFCRLLFHLWDLLQLYSRSMVEERNLEKRSPDTNVNRKQSPREKKWPTAFSFCVIAVLGRIWKGPTTVCPTKKLPFALIVSLPCKNIQKYVRGFNGRFKSTFGWYMEFGGLNTATPPTTTYKCKLLETGETGNCWFSHLKCCCCSGLSASVQQSEKQLSDAEAAVAMQRHLALEETEHCRRQRSTAL